MKKSVSWKNLQNNNDANSTNSTMATHYALRLPNISVPTAPSKPVIATKSALYKNVSSVVPTFAKTKATDTSMPKIKLSPPWYEELPERKSLKSSPATKARDNAIERVYALAGSGPEVTAAIAHEQAARKEINDAQEAVVLSTASILGGDAKAMTLDDIVELAPNTFQFYKSQSGSWTERIWKQYKRATQDVKLTPEESRFSKAVQKHAAALISLEQEKKLAALGYKRPVKKVVATRKANTNNNNNNVARRNLNALSNYMRKTLRKRK